MTLIAKLCAEVDPFTQDPYSHRAGGPSWWWEESWQDGWPSGRYGGQGVDSFWIPCPGKVSVYDGGGSTDLQATKKTGVLVRAGCPGTRLMKMPPTHISSQNSYGPNTYLCALQRLSLPQDSDINDFIFGLLNRKGKVRKYRSVTSTRILDIRISHLLHAMAQWAESLSKNTFTLWIIDTS